MGVEHEIVKHFRLCASLMSDPAILRMHPEIIANQFNVAKSSIELLNQFLVPREPDPCDCHAKGWLDSTIISKGVGVLVYKTLKAHMEVVVRKEEDFPRIVREDFKTFITANPSENLFIREMKETNCMGSIVLLYYYLYWYLLLILMNRRQGNDSANCSEGGLNIEWLIQNLPGSYDFLEFRHLTKVFSGSSRSTIKQNVGITFPPNGSASGSVLAALNFMFGSEFKISTADSLTRKTLLVGAYRRALATNLGGKTISEASIDLPELISSKTSMYIYNLITNQVVLYGMSVMGGMASEFECQSSTQRWEDMEIPVVVMGKNDDSSLRLCGNLKRILSSQPYAYSEKSWLEKGQCACIFDYCSAALMMDICKSFQKLVDVVSCLLTKESNEVVSKYLILFLVQNVLGSREKNGFISYLKRKSGVSPPGLFDSEIFDFVNKSSSTWSDAETIKTLNYNMVKESRVALWVDKFKSLYPVKHLNVMQDVNHMCYLWGYEGKDSPEPLFLIQAEIYQFPNDAVKFLGEYAWYILGLFLSNSWFVAHTSSSVSHLINSFKDSKLFYSASCKWADTVSAISYPGLPFESTIKRLRDMPETAQSNQESALWELLKVDDLKNHEFIVFTGYGKKIKDTVEEECKKLDQDIIDLCILSNNVKSRMESLSKLALTAKSFKKFPALMWPVQFKQKDQPEQSNISCFTEITRRMENHGSLENALIATRAPGNSPFTGSKDTVSMTMAAIASADAAVRIAKSVGEIAARISLDSSSAPPPPPAATISAPVGS